MKNTFSKGFTLVELLIVIAILAALVAVVAVVLNPAELLAQARDSQRLRDMTTVRDAINIHLSQVPAAPLCGGTVAAPTPCPVGGTCTVTVAPATGPFGGATPLAGLVCALDPDRLNDGTGWVAIDFRAMPGGAALSTLPMDPVNNANFFYAYRADNVARTFKIATRLESEGHRRAMALDGGTRNCSCPSTAGGTDSAPCTAATAAFMTAAQSIATNCFYEVGTNMAL